MALGTPVAAAAAYSASAGTTVSPAYPTGILATDAVLLFVGMSGPMTDRMSGVIWYPSIDACLAAHKVVSATIPYDHQVECRETTAMSWPARPMPRPEVLK